MNYRRKLLRLTYDYSKICLSAALLALAYILFVIPNDFAPAGINGIATMVQYKLHFSVGYFSLIINIPLCILAFFFVDRDFGIKSLVFSIVYSATYLLFQNIDMHRFEYNAYGVDTIYPCLIAGMFSGLVYGICFRVNASTGGTDIIAKGISQKNPLLNFFWVKFVLNASVAGASLFVYGKVGIDGQWVFDYKPVCLCVLYCFVASFVGNYILQGFKTAYKFIIITPHSEAIEKEILEKLHHSATRLHGKGIYSEVDKEVLLCVVNKHKIIECENILQKYPDTFAFVETVNETFGNFSRNKK